MRTYAVMAVAALLGSGLSTAATAQVVPSPALDSPAAPLAGPPPNQPPRQLQPEANAASDPAVVNAQNGGSPAGASKSQEACARAHPGYNPATRSYVDEHSRQHTCG